MTGIQALERIAPTKVMQPGQVERREFEYERHGTLSLSANFDVVSGQVVSPSLVVQPSRVDGLILGEYPTPMLQVWCTSEVRILQ